MSDTIRVTIPYLPVQSGRVVCMNPEKSIQLKLVSAPQRYGLKGVDENSKR